MSQFPRIRILIAAHSGSRGGAEFCLDTTLRHLDRGRFEPSVCFAWEGPMADSARALGIPVQIVPWAWWMGFEWSAWHVKNLLWGSVGRVWRLACQIRREKIDVVYTNTAVVFEAALAARLAGVPHVWHVHEILRSRHLRPSVLPLWLVARVIGWLSDRVIFESESARAVCRGRIAQGKSLAVYNSVRFNEGDQTDRGAARASLGLADGCCAVVWIGQFSPRKDPLLLLRAVPRIKQAGQAMFFLAGEGPLENELRQTIRKLGLDSACRLLPFQEDVRGLIAAAHVARRVVWAGAGRGRCAGQARGGHPD